uniref:Uncharacterized protein n=1 Tax=Nelumbo nucifera TaxID=4432 RepID=A0A822ZCF0_NELNU|nr:TPA_asm: hypothetical protein HUJ06_015482 [Nelumbo nucifera]
MEVSFLIKTKNVKKIEDCRKCKIIYLEKNIKIEKQNWNKLE